MPVQNRPKSKGKTVRNTNINANANANANTNKHANTNKINMNAENFSSKKSQKSHRTKSVIVEPIFVPNITFLKTIKNSNKKQVKSKRVKKE